MAVARACAVAFIAILGLPRPAAAIPAFARMYQVPCSTCHTTITRRSEFGDAFRKSGFRWPGSLRADENVRQEETIEMKGISAARGVLPAIVPLGIRGTIASSYSNDANAVDPITLGSPSFRFLLASTLGQHFAVFLNSSSRGSASELYLHVTRIADQPELNLRVGSFEQTTTLFKNNESLINQFLISSSALNGHAVGSGRAGAEVNGTIAGRTFWAAGIVQNAGVGSGFDPYYHLSYKLGGMNLHGEEPDVDLDEPSALEDIVVTIGHWGYWGTVSDAAREDTSSIRRLGLEAKLRFRKLTAWGGAMLGFDRDLTVDRDNHSLTWFGEIGYSVRSWIVPMYMYQFQDASSFEREYQQHDVGVLLMLLENLRARIKVTIPRDGTANEGADLQLLFGF